MVIEKTPTEYIIRIPATGDFRVIRDFLQSLGNRGTKRSQTALSAPEARLLEKINQGIPAAMLERAALLHEKRRAGSLRPEEQSELLGLTAEIEKKHLTRMKQLLQLAVLQRVTLPELMQKLGIKPYPTHGEQG